MIASDLDAVKIATWNVNGMRARMPSFMQWLDSIEPPDVICLQEIKAAPGQIPEPLRSLPGYHVHWHGNGGYSGVALMLREARFAAKPVPL